MEEFSMHFVITAFDGKDSEAGIRRKNAREKHLEVIKKAVAEGKHLYAAAILDDEGNAIGSIMIVNYPSKEILVNEWLNNEPYVTDGVWKEIDIKPCKVPDIFFKVNE
jgi:hypothetical protein